MYNCSSVERFCLTLVCFSLHSLLWCMCVVIMRESVSIETKDCLRSTEWWYALDSVVIDTRAIKKRYSNCLLCLSVSLSCAGSLTKYLFCLLIFRALKWIITIKIWIVLKLVSKPPYKTIKTRPTGPCSMCKCVK